MHLESPTKFMLDIVAVVFTGKRSYTRAVKLVVVLFFTVSAD
jgi:hypothetical protein